MAIFRDPQNDRKVGATRILSKSVETYFDTFLSVIDAFSTERKRSKFVLTLLDDFSLFLTETTI